MDKLDPELHEIFDFHEPGPRPVEIRPSAPKPDQDEWEKFFEALEFQLSTGAPPEEPGATSATGEPFAKRAGASGMEQAARIEKSETGWTREYRSDGSLLRAYAPGVQPEIVFTR